MRLPRYQIWERLHPRRGSRTLLIVLKDDVKADLMGDCRLLPNCALVRAGLQKRSGKFSYYVCQSPCSSAAADASADDAHGSTARRGSSPCVDREARSAANRSSTLCLNHPRPSCASPYNSARSWTAIRKPAEEQRVSMAFKTIESELVRIVRRRAKTASTTGFGTGTELDIERDEADNPHRAARAQGADTIERTGGGPPPRLAGPGKSRADAPCSTTVETITAYAQRA